MRPAQMTVQGLPADLLQRILQQLSVKECLGSAALVHSTWHLAAVAATGSIALTIPAHHTTNARQQQLDRFLAWVRRYGDRVPQTVTLKAPLENYHLATHHLQALSSTVLLDQDLSCTGLISLQLAPVDTTGWRQGALQSCYGLTSLELRSFNLLSPAASMASLAAMTSLQRLCLAACANVFTGPVLITSSFLHKLDHLTSLQLDQPAATADSLQQLSCLTRLRDFVLEFLVEVTGSIHHAGHKPLVAAASSTLCLTPNLAQLTSLRNLALRDCQCDPAELTPLLLLQSLDLSGTRCSNSAALLGWVSQLQHLTYLNVQGCLQLGGDAEPAPLTAYAALTASSGLQRLACSADALPKDARMQMFPADKLLSGLRELRAWKWQGTMRDASGVRASQQQQRQQQQQPFGWWQQQQQQIAADNHPQLSDGDLLRLVRCCSTAAKAAAWHICAARAQHGQRGTNRPHKPAGAGTEPDLSW